MSEKSRAHPANLSMIEKRRIEAEILAHVYAVMKDEVGVEAAQRTIGEAVRRSSVEQAQRFAQEAQTGTSLETFVETTKLWETDDALQIAVKERSERVYAFDVVRCRYAEMYKAMGLGEIGHLLSCQRDATFCQGYDPKLKLTRTQTIMQGAGCCDFRYVYEDEGEGAPGEAGPAQ
jgi:hypothetical protein